MRAHFAAFGDARGALDHIVEIAGKFGANRGALHNLSFFMSGFVSTNPETRFMSGVVSTNPETRTCVTEPAAGKRGRSIRSLAKGGAHVATEKACGAARVTTRRVSTGRGAGCSPSRGSSESF